MICPMNGNGSVAFGRISTAYGDSGDADPMNEMGEDN